MKETINYLNELFNDNDVVVLGLSGGPDSMCLLDVLLSLNKSLNIICAHINHNIRKESFEEASFLKKYCEEKKLNFETTTFSKKSETENYNELELREKRYDFFSEIIKKYNAKYLLTAHHGDDLIETILMRLTRGSNLKGYSGIQLITDKKEYKIVRPLLFSTKDEIELYNKENNIPFVIDKTNEQDDYTRNRYRHNVLPFLKSENKEVHIKYLQFSKELQEYYKFVNKYVEKELSIRYNNGTLNIDKFTELDDLLQTKIIEQVLDYQYVDNLYLINNQHIIEIKKLINSERPNIEISLPDDLIVIKSYNTLTFTRHKNEKKGYLIKVEDNTLLPNNHIIQIISDNTDKSNYVTRINSKEVKLPLYVRQRKDGDKMVIKNMNDSKKIKSIFIDSKLSKEQRDNQPIVVDSNENIIWLPGLKKSKFDKDKNENYDIILWYN